MTIARITPFAVGIALVAVASVASAQQPARETSLLSRLEQTLDRDTYRAVAQVIDGARARALPTDPLVDRALEGAMKRAPGPRIRAAVATLAQRLEVAKKALAPSPTESDIAAGAGALGVGVPGETLREIRAIQPNHPIAVPLGVLTELVSRSVPVDRATRIVVELLRGGATPPQLVALGENVQRDIAAGIEPSAALDIRTRGVASALPGATALNGDALGGAPNAPAAEGFTGNTGGTPRNGNNARPPVGGTRRP
jgi:hypothetical protein